MRATRASLEHFSDEYTRRDAQEARPIWAEIAAEFEATAYEYVQKHAGSRAVKVCLMDWIAETLEESFGAVEEARELRQSVVADINDSIDVEEEQKSMRWA